MWYNKYIGIPYISKGRDAEGLDCWGLVRLVYKEQYNIDLPSLSEEYAADDSERHQELISLYKEGWDKQEAPTEGDVVVFRVLGSESHVGIYIGNGLFMHAREGVNTVVAEAITSITWAKRIRGYFKYTERTSTVLNSVPHPLRTEHYTDYIVPGTTVSALLKRISTKYSVSEEIKLSYQVMIDGIPVLKNDWDTKQIKLGEKVEFRAVPEGGNTMRTLLTIAVIVAAAYVMGPAGAEFGASAASTTGVGTAAGWQMAAAVTINVAGMALVNAIAPIRMPGQNDNSPGSANRQNLYSGGTNTINKYGAIPVVLGKARITPPLGATQYVDFSDPEKSRLISLLTWGYGPLEIRDLQIGTNDLDTYVSYQQETLYGYAPENQQRFNDMYPADVEQQVLNQKLINVDPAENTNGLPTDALNPWTEITTNQKCTDLSIALHFPEGMRQLVIKGEGAGDVREAYFTAIVQYRRVDDNNIPVEDWSAAGTALTSPYTKVIAPTGTSPINGVPLYQWVRIYIDSNSAIQTLVGAKSDSQNSEPSAQLLALYSQESYASLVGTNKSRARLPTLPGGSISLYDICVGPSGVVNTVDYRSQLFSHSGLDVTTTPQYEYYSSGDSGDSSYYTGVLISVGTGSCAATTGSSVVNLGGADKYQKKKDAFTEVIKYSGLVYSRYQIRIKRTNYDTVESADGNTRNYNVGVIYSVTGFSNRTKPTVNPPGCYIAKTVLNILSSDNVNGRLEGINGLVHSICLDWDRTAKTWSIQRTTSNPASLFIHVLTHPANAFKISLQENRLNLQQLGEWHEYCQDQGFEYNNVLDGQRSVLEVLKDIAAAGRASPNLIDGKWSVVIDKPRNVVVQHFTPYNSWGFESTKRLPRQPDAFRVTFRNEEKAYIDETILILNKGITESTASLIEEISLPGVTNKTAAYKHGRWHLAQLMLRPEVYTLNTDFEYLVCNRGDLVRVTNDVADWGTGSGRIKNFIDATTLDLDQPVYLERTKTYNIRVRTPSGASVLRTLVAVASTRDYTTITLTQPITAQEVADEAIFMVGELNKESQELIVISVETMGNTSARLTLVDYSPQIYSVDANIGGEYAIPVYNPLLTQLPEKLIETITQVPQLLATTIKSDESVITRGAGGSLISNIRVPYSTPNNLPKTVTYIETQYDYSSSTSTEFQFKQTDSVAVGSALLANTPDGTTYKIRSRYLTSYGILGPWSPVVLHTVVGKTSPPSNVPELTGSIEPKFGKVLLSWKSVPDIDLAAYEIREADSNWGSDGYLFKGLANSCFLDPNIAGAQKRYYIKAIDVVGNYSATAKSFILIVAKPAIPVVSTNNYFNQTSLTNSAVKVSWVSGSYVTGSLNVAAYEIEFSYTDPVATSISTVVSALEWESSISWNGSASFRVRSIDIAGNTSEYSNPVSIVKQYPATPSTPNITVSGTNIEADWVDTPRTSLPIAGYEIRTSDENWGFTGAVWKGSSSSALISMIGKTAGTYTWFLRSYDSDGKYCQTSRSFSYTVVAPVGTVINTPVFQDTSLTNATVTLSWAHVKPIFGLYGYEVDYGANVVITKSNSITIPASWLGDQVVSVKTIDNLITDTTSNMSAPVNIIVTVSAPNPIDKTSYRAQVIDNTVLLYWALPSITTLPISHVRIKRNGTSWETAEAVGDKSGTFTSFSELSGGTYTYRIATVDTEGNESVSIDLTTEVSQPPNFVFNAEYNSTFSGIKTNAVIEANTDKLILPVDTSETWESHFSANSWTNPSDQVAAGYPVFIQPGDTTGSYVEVFDYLSELASSQATLSLGGTVIAGNPILSHIISTSLDGITYTDYPGSNSVFATNFRYIKISITIAQGTPGSMYRIDSVNVRLDSKQKSDSGNVVAKYNTSNGTDIYGTIINFNQEFIDVSAITPSVNSTQPLIAVCDFLDTSKVGTYSITNNVCTITIPTDSNGVAHNLLPGQNVRIFFTTGIAPSGVYTVLTATNNTYTVAVTSANTSGNVNTYPNSMRVYVYNQNGVRQNNVQVSWQIQGY